MSWIWNSPARNLIGGIGFVLAVMVIAIAGYMLAGWDFGDSLYMTVITVFTVGYDEVRPVDTFGLRGITIGLIVVGCTGMIFVTGALFQFITVMQIQQVLGLKRMRTEIDNLRNHVIICGFGRTGQMLARELRAGLVNFVLVERSDLRFDEARAVGYLCIHADATEEETLQQAGIKHARALATVLPDDATNVYITLSARSLSKSLVIIARGELPGTEKKLRHAGANEVVLPAHIGAERVAELILYPGAISTSWQSSRMLQMETDLRRLGLEMETIVAERGGFAGLTVEEAERRGKNAFFIVAIERQEGHDTERPDGSTRIELGDGVKIIGRGGRARMLELFEEITE